LVQIGPNRAKQSQIGPLPPCTPLPPLPPLPLPPPGYPSTHPPCCDRSTHRRRGRVNVLKVSTRLLLESPNTPCTLKHGLNHCFTVFSVLLNGPFSSAVRPGSALFLKWTRITLLKPLFYTGLLVH